MTTTTETNVTAQVYQVYIKATAEAIWDAITKPEWTERYGYGGRGEYDLRPGGAYQGITTAEMRSVGAPEVGIDGEVMEVDPPHKLVLKWRMLMDEALAAEGFTLVTYEIEANEGSATKLTVIHDLEHAPKVARIMTGKLESEGAGGGWPWILSDLKTLLETGKSFAV